VRIRSSEATSLKATLKKVIRDVTTQNGAGDEEDFHVGGEKDVGNSNPKISMFPTYIFGKARRRYLDYDLEALYSFLKPQKCDHVFVAFEDSEGFDSGLLSELILLFKYTQVFRLIKNPLTCLSTWRPRIPFTILFGIATSVELLQARLLKSTCQQIHGAQFDVVQAGAILETVVKVAVAASNIPLRIGGNILRSMLDRQLDQVAGIQLFVSSLKVRLALLQISSCLRF
jgi:origin recognition complex subunit 3